MSLGEAFIEIHADLRPFARDLRRNIKPIVDAFEKEINQAVNKSLDGDNTEKTGRNVGNRLSMGIKRSLTEQFKNKNAFLVIAASLGSALDDGISALPTEVKAAIVGGIILAIPIVSAFLAAAITAAVGVGVAGLGVLLASQFEGVQEAATEFGRNTRNIFVESARSFGDAIIRSLSLAESRIRALQPLLTEVFDLSAPFLEPLIQGAVGGFEDLIRSIRASLGDIRPFINELGAGIQIILRSVGKAIEILSRTGKDGQTALRDLARLIATIITSTAILLTFFTKLYGVIRDTLVAVEKYSLGLSPILTFIASLIRETDNASNEAQAYAFTNEELTNSFLGLASATDDETKELKAFNTALGNISDAVKEQLDLNIAWEQSLDDIAKSLKENGKTLDITNDKGRNNAREFKNALDIAEERTLKMLREGKITSDQAVAQFNQQTEALRRMATQAGISETEFNQLFGEIIATAQLRLSSEEMGINSLANELGKAGSQAERLLARLEAIRRLASAIGSGALAGVRGFADGGMHFLPEIVRVAEDGPEVTIPLTKPARAATLMRESGLDKMVSGGGTQVMVFIGNEQLDARMVRVVERNNAAQGLALANGGRNF